METCDVRHPFIYRINTYHTMANSVVSNASPTLSQHLLMYGDDTLLHHVNALPMVTQIEDVICRQLVKLGKCSSMWKAGQKIMSLRSNHSGYGVGQWEKALHSNACYHWLSPYPEWSLQAKGVWLYIVSHLELYSLSGKTSSRQISLSFG